ncbi:MAG: DNA mismatch repair endonuclease MutL [Holosporales bacterium]|jgi:DNA mismatch repair protein MutL|nr:DNA mismatch repair endonuclease MutL [Holosporales bacterium]
MVSKIKLLSDDVISQIAAGEIVERPSSALKEIVENSIDAEAKNIEIFLKNGGKTKLVVEDDGFGLSKEDLKMAIQRHATSKLKDSNLFDISSYGFRGEALPSIASVSEFTLESNGFGISVAFSEKMSIFPSNIDCGTVVTVKNIFDKTPARLKFLKSDGVELAGCISVVENFALIMGNVNFVVRTEDSSLLSFQNDSIEERIEKIFGNDVAQRAVYFQGCDDNLSISGYLFHPIDSRYSQSFQKIFVNGRIVKDKVVASAIKNAYKNLVPTGRFAIVIAFIEVDPFYVDVNVSPTKSEIRFRDGTYVYKFITNVIRKNLAQFDRVLLNFNCRGNTLPNGVLEPLKKVDTVLQTSADSHSNVFEVTFDISDVQTHEKTSPPRESTKFNNTLVNALKPVQQEIVESERRNFFGVPVAQVFDSYIITETEDGIVIIDQHAVHEKITQNKLLKSITKDNKQFLIKPEIIELQKTSLEVAKSIMKEINECGFVIEIVQSSLVVSAIPAILNSNEAVIFVKDVTENFDISSEIDIIDSIRRKIANIACHSSIRFGKKLSMDEMFVIVKQMEDVGSIHQCNHHRPSFAKISKNQLKKMFDRH